MPVLRLQPISLSIALLVAFGCTTPTGPESGVEKLGPVDWELAEAELEKRVRAWLGASKLARRDGYIYTVDIAQLLGYAARRQDRALFDALTPHAEASLVPFADNDYHRGFVTWRSSDAPADATGTTEALRLAEALWIGSEAFEHVDERARAREILAGYGRHGFTDQGVWLIRNYYNLQTGAFATNSFLVDYDVDLLHHIAAASQDPELTELARRSDAAVESARTNTGLVHELIQPEVLTALPGLGSAAFSPNRVAQLSNSCVVIERALVAHPEWGRQLLRFAKSKLDDKLNLLFDAETGDAHGERLAGIETLGCLLRVAHRLGAEEAPFEQAIRWFVRDFLVRGQQPRAYLASELLHTAAVLTTPASCWEQWGPCPRVY